MWQLKSSHLGKPAIENNFLGWIFSQKFFFKTMKYICQIFIVLKYLFFTLTVKLNTYR